MESGHATNARLSRGDDLVPARVRARSEADSQRGLCCAGSSRLRITREGNERVSNRDQREP
jgi:hypothetical protein